jgi:hypothetical protein
MIHNRPGGPAVSTRPNRLAWLRLNAYGLLLVGLTTMSILKVRTPEDSNVARAIGYVSAWQPFWTWGIFIAGLLLLYGFARSRTGPEVAGLVLLSASMTAQAAVAAEAIGPGRALDQLLAWFVVVLCSALRASVLLSKDGLTFTIDGRHDGGA